MSIFTNIFNKQTPLSEPVKKTEKFDLQSKVFHYSKVESPLFKEDKAKGWINYGAKNDYPEFLLDLLQGSALHNGIVMGKSYLVAGDDFLVDGLTLSQLRESNLNEYLKVNDLIENGYNENLYDIKSKIALDYIISGSYCLKLTWSLDFSKIVEIEYVPWTTVRASIKNEDGKVEHYYVSENWKGNNIKAEKYQAFTIDAHLPDGVLPEEYESVDQHPFDNTQILYVKNHFPGYIYYGRPSYTGAVTEIKATNVLSEFYYSSIQNGFTPSMVITFNEEPGSAEEGRSVTRRLEEQFTVKGVGRKLAVFFAKGKDLAPTFTTLDVKNLDAQMLQIQNQLFASIVAGHSVTSPELVGIAVPGKLGTSDLDQAYKIFKNTVINKDKDVLERTFNMISSINGITGKITISDKNPLI